MRVVYLCCVCVCCHAHVPFIRPGTAPDSCVHAGERCTVDVNKTKNKKKKWNTSSSDLHSLRKNGTV
ncbi:hypothetical protein WN55_08476 [Dufourea novaeangliae]|uniref:Secreted protein n=1 Tax=Dufourea novaeangliae TaxID=178035 RepID=A0A154P6X8_DUFNO|nr:hypothetical protein WN55_08476 [Dufourea novaeangliae]